MGHGTPNRTPGRGLGGGAGPASEEIQLTGADPAWASQFAVEAQRVRKALGSVALRVEHIGSTSVPGLPAKPIIDIDLWVEDSDREERYIPGLASIGYVLALREPWWNGHRMLVNSGTPKVNLHVFPADAPEPLRHLLFRDWLCSHDEDRDLYAAVKRRLAVSTSEHPAEYNLAKNEVIDLIYARVFAAPRSVHPAWPLG